MRHERIERELVALSEAADRLRADVVAHIEMLRRQTPPQSAADYLCRAILAENEVAVLRTRARIALRDLASGNAAQATQELCVITGDDPVKTEPLHAVGAA